MKNLFVFSLLILLFTACQTDQKIQDDFVGTYDVTIETPESNKDLEKAKKEMQKDLEEARENIRDDIQDAKKEIEAEFGEDSGLGKAIGSFVEGMGHFAESMTSLGEAMGNLGIDIGTSVLGSVRFTAEFQSDGEVVFGKKRGINIRGDDLRWKIEHGKMVLWNRDEGEKEATVFEIEKISDTEIDLIGEEVIFHLVKEE